MSRENESYPHLPMPNFILSDKGKLLDMNESHRMGRFVHHIVEKSAAMR